MFDASFSLFWAFIPYAKSEATFDDAKDFYASADALFPEPSDRDDDMQEECELIGETDGAAFYSILIVPPSNSCSSVFEIYAEAAAYLYDAFL